ncbi:MAG TPA: thioredoxin-like domain-containing protein [Chthoniobacteraceae bacterium]|nr:thioredoxin-like domain-containing protein [Chthoniobacteraceae bacterium]
MKKLILGMLCLGTLAPSLLAEAIAPSLKGDLVAFNGKEVTTFDDAPLANARHIAIYYSAEWCPPCKIFTPELVKWYNEHKPQHPEFELIFVSSDHDEKAMKAYMAAEKMKWPALTYAKVAGNKSLKQFAGPGIPCLVLIDSEGKVVSHSFEGEKYVGPRKVLADINKTLGVTTTPEKPAAPSASTGAGTSIGGTGGSTGTGLGLGTAPKVTPSKSLQGRSLNEIPGR